MSSVRKLALAMSLVGACGVAAVALAERPDALLDALLQRPARVGTVVVPDRYLRSWDPVTVFYPAARGPSGGGPEDDPARFVSIDPAQPGGWEWLDDHTLQFRPAEPWPPLSVVTARVDGASTDLFTLMAPPTASNPRDGASGLSPVRAITLDFDAPVDPRALAERVRVALRPLPGLGDDGLRLLDADDFEVKALDRSSASDPASYTLVLREEIPAGTQATLRLALSLDDAAEEAVREISFRTAEPFRVSSMGCAGRTLPVSSAGTRYAPDQPLRCTSRQVVSVEFTSPPRAIGPVEARNLLRFEPSVEGVEAELVGRRLEVSGRFARETPYTVTLTPTPLTDRDGRALQLDGPSEVHLYFARQDPYLQWTAGHGILERKGPQRVPLEGRGQAQVDLRIYRVDPLNRDLWPWSDTPIAVDESARPPGPGERPAEWSALGPIGSGDLQRRLMALGSPAMSGPVDLPLSADRGAATFGLDLAPHLQRIAGRDQPGHYLVGLRRLDGGTERRWMRVQVTDLSLATVESADSVRFVVTSLGTGAPVAGARVVLEAEVKESGSDASWEAVIDGRTDAAGQLAWEAPGKVKGRQVTLRRLRVEKGEDRLVLNPARPPERYHDGHWREGSGTWLAWAFSDLEGRREKPAVLGHLFSERPVYRPEEPVHFKGYIRRRHQGRLAAVRDAGHVVVEAPGGAAWRLPVEVTALGSFYVRWDESDIPTGTYEAWFEAKEGERLGRMTFRVEAYRLPTFEVELTAAGDRTDVPNDAPFEVELSAAYYAGGSVAARPVRWQVTQYPYTWAPEGLDGFVVSSDGRYARAGRFDSTPAIRREAATDRSGAARLVLDPGIEPDAQPRTYVIEATVTDADEQTVTAVHRVHAVPALVLGLDVPRYLEEPTSIPVRFVAAGPDGASIPGRDVTVRLLQRQWHSLLQSTDFSDGVARYTTDVVDVPVSEQVVRTTDAPGALDLPIEEPGVYIVELEARDRLGRAQVVRVDLYAGGAGDVAWSKPESGVFDLSLDAPSHVPGERAMLLLRSPFQTADALVVVEAPDGNRYRTVKVRGGKATVPIDVEPGWVPRLPVHVLLRRGRREDAPEVAGTTDLGKPQTVASTAWLVVRPRENTVVVELDHPAKAMPGETVPVTVTLTDPDGEPVAGEVALWLVDQAVLALGKEQRLDPKPDFITRRDSRVFVHDTRNQAFGRLPFADLPGGDGGEEGDDVLEKATIRKDFKPVPYFEPALQVGPSGTATVRVPLPDNLTVFKLRAKAISGEERFGVGTGSLRVRLPVVVQPDLPRFVRPGDRLQVAALGRVVEGTGGDGAAQIEVDGLDLAGTSTRAFDWDADLAERVAWEVSVPTPTVGEGGTLVEESVRVRIGARREEDGASDAFEAVLPLRDDRRPLHERKLALLAPGGEVRIPEVGEAAREGSVRRQVVVADSPALTRLAAGLDLSMGRPAHSTSQRLGRARGWIGLGALREPLGLAEGSPLVDAAVAEALSWLPGVVDARGLVAAWPGGQGSVWAAADALEFLVEAQEAGYAVDRTLMDRLVRALESALRSDYRYFVRGEQWLERTRALSALAHAGRLDQAYLAELGRNARYLGPEGRGRTLLAAARAGADGDALVARLVQSVEDDLIVRMVDGTEQYGGLESWDGTRNPRILPSEARALAVMTRGLLRTQPETESVPLMLDALVRLGMEDGWGDPVTDTEAMLALAERFQTSTGAPVEVSITESGGESRLTTGSPGPLVARTSASSGAAVVRHDGGPQAAVFATTRYIPAAPGSAQAAAQRGFVVSRDWAVIGDGAPRRVSLGAPGTTLRVEPGTVIEDHVQVVNPEARSWVAITAPLAAGVEGLNPALATAPPEATPSKRTTRAPTWTRFADDAVTWYFEELPKGTFDFAFRVRATTAGSFVQPAAVAELVYDPAVWGGSPGAEIVVREP